MSYKGSGSWKGWPSPEQEAERTFGPVVGWAVRLLPVTLVTQPRSPGCDPSKAEHCVLGLNITTDSECL